MKRMLSCLVAAGAISAVAAPAAMAEDPGPTPSKWTCSAKAVGATLLGTGPYNIIQANPANDPCKDDGQETLIPIFLPPEAPHVIRSETANAVTYDLTASHNAADSRASIEDAGVDLPAVQLSSGLNLGPIKLPPLKLDAVKLTASVIDAEAVAKCNETTNKLTFLGLSRVVDAHLTIGGFKVPVNITADSPTVIDLGLAKIVFNEQIKTSRGITVNAIHITVPLLKTDIVLSQARAGVSSRFANPQAACGSIRR